MIINEILKHLKHVNSEILNVEDFIIANFTSASLKSLQQEFQSFKKLIILTFIAINLFLLFMFSSFILSSSCRFFVTDHLEEILHKRMKVLIFTFAMIFDL